MNTTARKQVHACDTYQCDRYIRTIFDTAKNKQLLESLVRCTDMAQLRNMTLLSAPTRRVASLKDPETKTLWGCLDAGPDAKHLLYLTRLDFVNTCVLIKLNGRMGLAQHSIVHLGFADDLYDGTVLMGDLLSNGRAWTFFVEDVLSLQGHPMPDTADLPARLSTMQCVLTKGFVPDRQADIFALTAKQHSAEFSFEPSDGYNFPYVAMKPPSAIGEAYGHHHFFQLPKADKADKQLPECFSRPRPPPPPRPQQRPPPSRYGNVRSFNASLVAVPLQAPGKGVGRLLYAQASRDPDVYELYESGSPSDTSPIGHAAVQTLEKSKWMLELFGNNKRRVLMRCEFEPRLNKWIPMSAVRRE